MAQIANASGIAVGQIYRDFANKEAIIAEINRKVDVRLRASLEAALVSLAPVTSG